MANETGTGYEKNTARTPAEIIKQPPYSIEAEQSVLGGLMLNNQTWELIADRIGETDFYRPDHQHIFAKIVDRHLGQTDTGAVKERHIGKGIGIQHRFQQARSRAVAQTDIAIDQGGEILFGGLNAQFADM